MSCVYTENFRNIPVTVLVPLSS